MINPKPGFMVQAALAAMLFGGIATTAASAGTCVGSCGNLGANGVVVAPPGGTTYGWVSTFGGIDGVGQLPGIPAGSTDGSTFTTSPFNATAGQTLHYHFNFVTSDGQDGAGNFIYEDYAWVQLVDATTGTPLVMLFNARTEPTGLIVPGTDLPPVDPGVVLNPAAVPITSGGPLWSPLGTFSGQCWGAGCGYTGWVTSDYTIAATGLYELAFGVSNWGDNIYDTGLAFSGLQVGGTPIDDSVPEPATWAVMLAALFGVGAAVSGRRRQTAAAR